MVGVTGIKKDGNFLQKDKITKLIDQAKY